MPITKGTQVLLVRCALCKGKALATRKPGAGDDFIVDEMRRRNYRVAVVDGEPRWVCYRHEPPEVELSDLIPTMDIGDLDRPSERVDPAGDASVASPKSPASGSGTSVAPTRVPRAKKLPTVGLADGDIPAPTGRPWDGIPHRKLGSGNPERFKPPAADDPVQRVRVGQLPVEYENGLEGAAKPEVSREMSDRFRDLIYVVHGEPPLNANLVCLPEEVNGWWVEAVWHPSDADATAYVERVLADLPRSWEDREPRVRRPGSLFADPPAPAPTADFEGFESAEPEEDSLSAV
jgi:hypothetical protein